MKIYALFIFLFLIGNLFALQKRNWPYNEIQGLRILIYEPIRVQRTLLIGTNLARLKEVRSNLKLDQLKANDTRLEAYLEQLKTNDARLNQIEAQLKRSETVYLKQIDENLQSARNVFSSSLKLQEKLYKKHMNKKRDKEHA